MCFNVLQCAFNVPQKHIQWASMCLQCFFNVFHAHWDTALFSMCKKHIEKTLGGTLTPIQCVSNHSPLRVFVATPLQIR